MKKVVIVFLMASFLAGCASAPKPKMPNENHRVPVNKTVPVEIQSGSL
ncbi:TrwH protein [Salmonella enterica]